MTADGREGRCSAAEGSAEIYVLSSWPVGCLVLLGLLMAIPSAEDAASNTFSAHQVQPPLVVRMQAVCSPSTLRLPTQAGVTNAPVCLSSGAGTRAWRPPRQGRPHALDSGTAAHASNGEGGSHVRHVQEIASATRRDDMPNGAASCRNDMRSCGGDSCRARQPGVCKSYNGMLETVATMLHCRQLPSCSLELVSSYPRS